MPGAGGEHRGRVVCAEAAEAIVRRASAEAAVEERLAGEVDAEGHVLAADACDDHDVRVADLDARAAAEASLHPVANRVLDAEGDELGVPELVVHAVGIDGEGGGEGKMALPIDRGGCVIELVCVGCGAVGEDEYDARGDAAPEADAVGVSEGAGEGHLAAEGADARGSQARELACEQALETLGASCEELMRVCHAHHLSIGSPFARKGAARPSHLLPRLTHMGVNARLGGHIHRKRPARAKC